MIQRLRIVDVLAELVAEQAGHALLEPLAQGRVGSDHVLLATRRDLKLEHEASRHAAHLPTLTAVTRVG